jgi:hypothetical protein
MALVLVGLSKCAICGEVIDTMDGCVATPAFVERQSDPMWQFSDAPMHRECFANWERRSEFVQAFNTHYAKHYRGMPVMMPNGAIEDRDPTEGLSR